MIDIFIDPNFKFLLLINFSASILSVLYISTVNECLGSKSFLFARIGRPGPIKLLSVSVLGSHSSPLYSDFLIVESASFSLSLPHLSRERETRSIHVYTPSVRKRNPTESLTSPAGGLIWLDSPREIDRGKKERESLARRRRGGNVETRPRENRTRCLVHSGTVSPFYRACHERPNFRLPAVVGPPNINQLPIPFAPSICPSLSRFLFFSFSPFLATAKELFTVSWPVAFRDKPGDGKREKSP